MNGPPSTNISVGRWRRELCEMTRSHLCQHENVVLHPRIRDETYKEKKEATEEEHSRAFLEHHKHAEAVLKYLIQRAG